jgi:hypothetical protein
MNSKRIWPSLALVLGILISLFGAALVVTYILEAIVARAGDPDQSLLFWYLPILFFGLIGLITGLSVGVWGFNRLMKIKPT